MKITFVYGMGLQVPLPVSSIAYLSAAIKATGRHKVSLIDCYLQKNKTRYVLDRIRKEKPDVVAFSVMSVYVEQALLLAEEIKKNFPRIPIVCGGVHAILRPMEILGCKAVDAVCVGEGEEVLVEYLDRLGREKMPQVKGFWYNTSGGVVKNEGRPIIADLDTLPYPDWDIWDMKLYMHSMLYVIGSRGCPFSCAYCSAQALRENLCSGKPELYCRVRSAENIIGEIKRGVARYGFHGFLPVQFSDSNFGLDKKQFREFTDLYIKEGLHKAAPWKGMVVSSAVDDDWARRAKESGCFSVDLGLEHSIEKVRMDVLGKKLTDADFDRAISALRKYRICYELNLIIGFNGEAGTDMLKNLFHAQKFKPLFFVMHSYMSFPETAMWKQHPVKKTAKELPYIEKKEDAFENHLFLAFFIKLINQLMIMKLAIQIHGFRIFSVILNFYRRFINAKEVSWVDFIRLCNYHIQQYYIYNSFSSKIKDRTYPLLENVFYRVSGNDPAYALSVAVSSKKINGFSHRRKE